MSELTPYRRAMILVTGSSVLVPLIGLATAPILTHTLGAAGRGAAGAAMAPNLLIVAGATMGLPQALTFFLGRRPHLSGSALRWATLLTLPLGLLTAAAFVFAAPYLSGGEHALAQLMLIGTFLAIPALWTNLLRGVATARQMWRAVAVERVLNSVLRLLLLAALALLGWLDVTTAVLVMCIVPMVSALAFARACSKAPRTDAVELPTPRNIPRALLAYGMRIWLGSVALMLLARSSQLFVTPLSNVEQLGLFIVAITIADVPYVITQAVQGIAFGANSASPDTARLQSTSRVATLVAVSGSAVLGVSLPLWIGVVFGQEFEAAILTTWLLLVASCIAVPGIIAGAGLDSVDRPGLRSTSLLLTLVLNVAGLFLLVPPLGAVGAALAGLLSTLFSTTFATVAASRILGTRAHGFFLPRWADVVLLHSMVSAVTRGRRRRGKPS